MTSSSNEAARNSAPFGGSAAATAASVGGRHTSDARATGPLAGPDPVTPARLPEGRPDDASLRRVRFAAWRFVLQRASAAVLAVCVVVHLATIIHAVREGLSSAAIVARMHESLFWPAFYVVFVVAVAIHAPLGLRTIADEWLGLRGRATDATLTAFALVLLAGGLYAVRALTA